MSIPSAIIPSWAIPSIPRRGAGFAASLAMLALALLIAPVYGANIGNANGTEVGPGTNPEVTITDQAETGDQIFIIFKPVAGWHFTKLTVVNDSAKLGWKPYAPHSFKLVVREDLAVKTFHSAQFTGEMAPDVSGGGGAPRVHPWDITGKFKLLYDHEGVGSDFKRTKPGALDSKKPDAPATPSGVATFNEGTQQFVGSFSGKYTGQFNGTPDAHPGTANPIDLHSKGDDHETIDCPDGDKVKVVKIYLGADDAGKLGGIPIPDPDTIEINTFSVVAELAKATAELAAAKAAKKLADEAVAALKAEIVTAEAEVLKRKADVEAAIAKVVAAAQAKVTAKEVELEAAVGAEVAAKAAFDKIVADGAPPGSARYKNAKKTYNDAVNAREKVATQLGNAQEKLAKARANAEKDPSVIAARTALAIAEATVQTKQIALTAAETVATAAEAAVTAAEALVAKYQDQQDSWVGVRDGTLIHENGHRRILYAHLDKMTTMLKTLRVWGYAVKEARAKVIAEIEFELIYNRHLKIISQMNNDMQGEGAGYDGITEHGLEQEQWTTWPDGTYP